MTYALPPPPKPEAVRLRRRAFIGGGAALTLSLVGALFLQAAWAFFVVTGALWLIAGVLLLVGAFAPDLSSWWEKRHQPRSYWSYFGLRQASLLHFVLIGIS